MFDILEQPIEQEDKPRLDMVPLTQPVVFKNVSLPMTVMKKYWIGLALLCLKIKQLH